MGIKGNITTRDYEISIENGDDFDMKGWFVANSQADTPACLNRFSRSGVNPGTSSGSDDAVVVEHNHVASSNEVGEHRHRLHQGVGGGTYTRLKVDGVFSPEENDVHVLPAGLHGHTITVNNEGVSGVGANKPCYINSIPIIRMS